MFDVDVKTIDRWCKLGKLTPIRVGSKVTRFRSQDVERFFNEHQVVPA
jgi:predicted site-specific integrase-resolvase